MTSATMVAREGEDDVCPRGNVGRASGIYNAGLDLGTVVGPAAGGVLASYLGIAGMFQASAAALTVLCLVLWTAASKPGRTGETAGMGE